MKHSILLIGWFFVMSNGWWFSARVQGPYPNRKVCEAVSKTLSTECVDYATFPLPKYERYDLDAYGNIIVMDNTGKIVDSRLFCDGPSRITILEPCWEQ